MEIAKKGLTIFFTLLCKMETVKRYPENCDFQELLPTCLKIFIKKTTLFVILSYTFLFESLVICLLLRRQIQTLPGIHSFNLNSSANSVRFNMQHFRGLIIFYGECGRNFAGTCNVLCVKGLTWNDGEKQSLCLEENLDICNGSSSPVLFYNENFFV